MKKRKKQKKTPPVTKGFFSSVSKGAWWAIGSGGVLLVLAGVFLLPALLGNKGIIHGYRPPAVSYEIGTVSRTEAARDEAKNEEYYQQQEKDVWYTYAGQSMLITDKNYEARNDQGRFFKEFIDSIKAGDWQSYQRFFVDEYFNGNETKEKMTPQKLYDIEVEYISDSKGITMAGKTYDVENFKVRYKILANDSTYRNDLPSDIWKPQVYQVAETPAGYRIVNIINVT